MCKKRPSAAYEVVMDTKKYLTVGLNLSSHVKDFAAALLLEYL